MSIGSKSMIKGIILAGGNGSRLYPMTNVITKQLLPVYDKPMIYYPLSTLMLLGIRDIMIITNLGSIDAMRNLLGDGSALGINIVYATQEKANGIAECFIIAEDFIKDQKSCLILGDNIFHMANPKLLLGKVLDYENGASIIACHVDNPSDYGVVELDKDRNIISIEEKPLEPKSFWAVTGLYFYDKEVIKIAKSLKPSSRGELEITDINKEYLNRGKISIELLGRGVTWIDTGLPDLLFEASSFIRTIEKRQGLKIACIEEIAYRMGYISRDKLFQNIDKMRNGSSYKSYLLDILHDTKGHGL